MRFSEHCRRMALVMVLGSAGLAASGQTNLSMYTDDLVNGFQDWSWATHSLTNTSPVHSGTDSIRVSDIAWTGISFEQAGFNSYQGGFGLSGYTNFAFWADGGASGGQQLQVYIQYGATNGVTYLLPPLPTNAWAEYAVPLTTLGVAQTTNAYRFNIQLTGNGSTNTFYLDDIQLTTSPGPAAVHVAVNTGESLRPADARWFGLNTAVWDGSLDTPQTLGLLQSAGARFLRFPGGSLSDQYDWETGTTLTNTWQWVTSFSEFVNLVTNAGNVQALITVNYGTGTPAEAAAWVATVTNLPAFKYWEVGNECYGNWETDSNTSPNDPYTYATRAAQYIQKMKAANPGIKIGVVAAPGEDSFVNYTTHAATNPVTGQVHYGWTPVMLSTLKSLGVTPDFLINHRYPEYSTSDSPVSSDCDALLLQSTTAWAGDAADLRGQLTDYLGSAGTKVELLTTENNSDAGAQGRQATSLVNALYYADSLAQIMQTEFNSYVWWDLRNGSDTTGSFDPTLYGWRAVGDFGMINDVTNCYPTYYAMKLMQHFASTGDTILGTTSDYSGLTAYASRHADGSVSLLAINKDPVTNLVAQLSLGGFVPGGDATVYTYGMAQDNAAKTGVGSSDVLVTNATVAGSSSNYSFPPYSLTLLTFPPASPRLQSQMTTPGEVVLQLQGQANVRYIFQATTNLMNATWAPVATNTLSGSTWEVTNAISTNSSAEFWRAVWLP